MVRRQLTRGLMKKIYMPLVYGQTRHSAQSDILKALYFTLGKGDAYKVADALYRFREERYPAIDNLMTLVNEVGCFAGYLKRPIRYHSEF